MSSDMIPGIPIVPVTAYSRTVVTTWVSHHPTPRLWVLVRARRHTDWRAGWAQKLYYWERVRLSLGAPSLFAACVREFQWVTVMR